MEDEVMHISAKTDRIIRIALVGAIAYVSIYYIAGTSITIEAEV